MKKNNYPGKFIVFEGLDGSGQSTEARLLKEFLETQGQKILLTKEPTKESFAGRKIEKILSEKEKISPLELQELFAKDREGHLKNAVEPALRRGESVISDRYCFSSFAYGLADGVPLKELRRLNEDFLLPDIVFFLDAKPKVCVQRIEKRGKKETLFEKIEKLNQTRFKNLTQHYGNIP